MIFEAHKKITIWSCWKIKNIFLSYTSGQVWASGPSFLCHLCRTDGPLGCEDWQWGFWCDWLKAILKVRPFQNMTQNFLVSWPGQISCGQMSFSVLLKTHIDPKLQNIRTNTRNILLYIIFLIHIPNPF